MIITIHQPLHFPYLGFFQKMKAADIFVMLDDVKFCKNEFYNRNKFRNKQGVDEWFTVPVEGKANSKLIKDVNIAQDFGWKKKLLKQMNYNFGGDFSEIYDHKKIIDVNIDSIEYCRRKLNIDNEIIYSSEMNIKGVKSERLANICKQLGATEYISGPFGKNYLDTRVFGDIKVSYFKPDVSHHYTTLVYLKELKWFEGWGEE